jgi:hypothetical protein
VGRRGQARGVERHTMSLFAIDSCYLQLARDKHLEKGQVQCIDL